MTDTDRRVTFFHSPRSRSAGVRILLEELGADYELHELSTRAGDTRKPEYLAVNPMGKVPAILHRGQLVTEQAAVYMYLAELYPEKRLSPPVGDLLRGPYLRWMVFYGSCFEPALVDRALKREPAPASTSPYGEFDTMFDTLDRQLAQGDWLLGERFTAADVLWGSALGWTLNWNLIPETPRVRAYIDRLEARPAVMRAREADKALAARLGA
ncbi:MAG TPA: glutathione S-transferase family protein [Burkholderiaceae bacterium]|nr:glutathione S-transferase family protein [Burkholderiaceae bacterium]